MKTQLASDLSPFSREVVRTLRSIVFTYAGSQVASDGCEREPDDSQVVRDGREMNRD